MGEEAVRLWGLFGPGLIFFFLSFLLFASFPFFFDVERRIEGGREGGRERDCVSKPFDRHTRIYFTFEVSLLIRNGENEARKRKRGKEKKRKKKKSSLVFRFFCFPLFISS